MKSVVQEASSLSKAFEQAWEKAGKPVQCTIKVLEESRHNFLGMTTRSAKIALFFDEGMSMATPHVQQPQPARTEKPVREKQPRQPKPQPQQAQPQLKAAPASQQPEPRKAPEGRPEYWNDDMVSMARGWFKDVLVAMGKSDISCTVDINRLYLRLSVSKPVYEDEQRERELFRSLSFLLLQTLRNKFNRPLKGYKVVLARGQ